MYKLLIVLALSVLVSSQDINSLIAQLPACIVPCYDTTIQNACGSPNDWSCACSSTATSNLDTACQESAYTCYSSDIVDAINIVTQICAIEDNSGSGAAATSGSSGGSPVTTAPVTVATAPSPSHSKSSSASHSRASRVRVAPLSVYLMEVMWLTLSAVWLWPL